MSLDDPVILTCAISGGVATREQRPAILYTPQEYAAEARRIVEEGGAMVHIRAEDAGRRIATVAETRKRLAL